MNYGFVIDNRSCIGCHACSTACKSENEVPLGVYRTWVKTTEVGTFPDVQRHFQVTRCNHCANPPCVRICPTAAMFQRDDGIVEFDSDACIGCKACLQACPYDAIYMDPESHTAAKCHYCAHRVEVGLEPACAVVCPTHAIIAGDLDDPASEISRVLSREKVSVRKPEQGTAPKVFYIDGAAVNLVPTATERTPGTFAAADVLSLDGDGPVEDHGLPDGGDPVAAFRGAPPHGGRAAPQPQGLPASGPLAVGRRMAGRMVQVTYNAQHRVPWHWPVPAYLVTKGIGSGAFLILAAAAGLGAAPLDAPTAVAGAAIAFAMMLATTGLLVLDLEHPERFLYILRRPQWRSWLARGAVALIGFTTVAGLWLASEGGAAAGLLPASVAEAARPYLFLPGALLAVAAAVYTAFLFGQAEGRDLWQSPLLPAHLLVQAVVAGAAALLVAAPLVGTGGALRAILVAAFALGLAADGFLILLGEFGMPHATETAARAAREITHGRYRVHFWAGAMGLGHAVPLALVAAGGEGALAAAGIAALAGLYLYEHAFVMAPQGIPNS